MRAANGRWEYRTRVGTFSIRRLADGRWHPVFRDRDLGSYASAEQALDDLVGGHTFSVPGIETDEVGLPDELGAWEFVPER